MTIQERLRQPVGERPICPDWMYESIRHCVRNMDFEWRDGFNEPDKYSGPAIADIVNAAPEAAALLDEAERVVEMFVGAHGKRRVSDSELLPPERQDGDIADGMRLLANLSRGNGAICKTCAREVPSFGRHDCTGLRKEKG
jgi:hypothetical protein